MDILFFFNDTTTTDIYPLSLRDPLPISVAPPPWGGRLNSLAPSCCSRSLSRREAAATASCSLSAAREMLPSSAIRSEEHTSELQSQSNLVCRLLLEKKKNNDELQLKDAHFCTDPQNLSAATNTIL